MGTQSDEVIVEAADNILLVTLNRPAARNAVNRAVSKQVAAAMDRLDESADLFAAVITGAGGNFCAGMDLKAFPEEGPPLAGGRGFGGITDRPPDKPVVAAVEGWALAGGFEIALAADMIVASSAARFGLPEVNRGLIAAAGGLVRLARALPYQTAMRIALTGEPVDAGELFRLGVIARLAEPGAVVAEAITLARQLGAGAPLSVRATKALVREAARWSDEQLLSRQSELNRDILASQDALEGARAFAEKRRPQWSGR